MFARSIFSYKHLCITNVCTKQLKYPDWQGGAFMGGSRLFSAGDFAKELSAIRCDITIKSDCLPLAQQAKAISRLANNFI
jgi:hypothetical protein